MSSQCGTICSTQIPTIPFEQRVSLQAQLSSHWKFKCSIEIQFFHRVGGAQITWSTNCSAMHTTAKFSRAQQALQGPTAPFLAIWVIRLIASFASLGDRHHRTSLTQMTKFGAWLWYQLLMIYHRSNNRGTPRQRLGSESENVKDLTLGSNHHTTKEHKI